MTITLFIDQSEYIDTLASSAGVRLLIHSQAEQPFPVDNGFTAIPGQKTSIQIINVSRIGILISVIFMFYFHEILVYFEYIYF